MLLSVKGLRAGYGKGDVLKDLSCTLDAGEALCVVGPNGCGKTTLFRALLGSVPPSGGSIMLDGQALGALTTRQRAQLVAYIPQNHAPVFSFTVLEVVMMGRASHFGPLEKPKPPDRKAAEAAMEKMGLLPLAQLPYTQLSGGQRQMVLIARALAQNAKLMVMDEPGASLDYANQQRLLAVVKGLAQQGYGVLMSTHNPAHPFAVASKALLMRDGHAVAFGPPAEAITPATLKQAYGIEMDVLTAKDRNGKPHTLCVPVG